MLATGQLAFAVALPERELCLGARRDSGRDQPFEAGGAPVDGMDPREHRQAIVDELPALLGRRFREESRTRVRRGDCGHLALDESHHEERRADRRGVAFVADEWRERHLRCAREPAHRAPLDLDLHVEPGRLYRIHRRLRHLASQHIALGRPSTTASTRSVSAE
jgi:hypothetical protein